MTASFVPRKPTTSIRLARNGSSHRFFIDIREAYQPSASGVCSKIQSPNGFSAFAFARRSLQAQQKATIPGTARKIGHKKSNHHFQSVMRCPHSVEAQFNIEWAKFVTRSNAQ